MFCVRRIRGAAPAILTALTMGVAVNAADLTVRIEGLTQSKGEVSIALFKTGDGFPMDAGKAVCVWLPANVSGVTHQFKGIMPGTFAVAAAHDLNGNRKLDTNWVGIPKEPWGVSNNVRPALRAPRFSEASFSVDGASATTISITLHP